MSNDLKCIVCGVNRPGGLVIRDKYICPECEDKIVALTVDHPEYDIIKESLKQIWFSADLDSKAEEKDL